MVVQACNPSTWEAEAGVPRNPDSQNFMYERQVRDILKKKKKKKPDAI